LPQDVVGFKSEFSVEILNYLFEKRVDTEGNLHTADDAEDSLAEKSQLVPQT